MVDSVSAGRIRGGTMQGMQTVQSFWWTVGGAGVEPKLFCMLCMCRMVDSVSAGRIRGGTMQGMPAMQSGWWTVGPVDG